MDTELEKLIRNTLSSDGTVELYLGTLGSSEDIRILCLCTSDGLKKVFAIDDK